MRRTFIVLFLVAAAGVAAALGASAYADEQEFERLVAAGDVAMAEAQPSAAIEAFSGAIALKPDAMLGHLKRGQAYMVREEWLSALRDLNRATALDPTAPLPLELLGEVNDALGRHDRAIRRYTARLALDDRSPRVLYLLALARYRAGDAAGALQSLDAARDLDKALVEAQYLRGLCLRDLGRLADAQAALEAAQVKAPGLEGPREALAEVYAARGDTRRALEQLEALVTLQPERPERIIALALAESRAGRHAAALATLRRARERFPDSARVDGALGHVWLSEAERGATGALSRAREALAAAAAHPDATGAILTDLGRAEMLAGDTGAAARALRQATSRLPVPPEAYKYLSSLAAGERQWQAARDHLVRYVTLVGDREPLDGIPDEIADLSERVNEPGTAADWLERAARASGATPDRLARIARLRLRAGDVPAARDAVRRGLALEPRNSALVALERQLAERFPASGESREPR